MTKTDEEIAREIVGNCTCDDAYKIRDMIDPTCAFHDFAEEIAAALRRVREETLRIRPQLGVFFPCDGCSHSDEDHGLYAPVPTDDIAMEIRRLARASNAPKEGETGGECEMTYCPICGQLGVNTSHRCGEVQR